ncbi:MAG TPA: chemotaxis protein CheW [Patescibacteria group bacterium]|nr:chemotaxis protein CheW [Patescibacteria group bacterium]
MDEEKNAQELQLVVFCLDKEEYALPITKVQEINRLVPITSLPQTPAFMEGVINLRGRSIPIVDVRKRFELPLTPHSDDTRIIVVNINGQTVGIIVDAVHEVIRLSSANVEPPPPTFILDVQYIHGIGKVDDRLVILIDIDKVLSPSEGQELSAVNRGEE